MITQLEGFEAPAAAWEAEILPARLDNYDFTWLDDLCLAGRAVWTRLTAPARVAGKKRGPDSHDARHAVAATQPRAVESRRAGARGALAGRALARASRRSSYLQKHGACFYDEIVEATGMLRTQVEDALAELVALGLVHSRQLRRLARAAHAVRSAQAAGRRANGAAARRSSASRTPDAGRSSGDPRRKSRRRRARYEPEHEIVEHIADTLLRRYGVVFWRILEREAAWLPPWRELLRVLRRLEARGEIRGGRFVAGISGEQFALPEAVESAARDAARAAVIQRGSR